MSIFSKIFHFCLKKIKNTYFKNEKPVFLKKLDIFVL